MKKLFTILLPALIIAIAVTQTNLLSKFTENKSTAFAVGDLTINWGVPDGQPIFTVNNIMPGDTEVRSVQILNGASVNRPVGVRGVLTDELKELSGVLEFKISNGAIDLYGGSLGVKTLTDFINESAGPNGLGLFSLNPSTDKTITFTVFFPESAGNDYQGAKVVFDIVIGISVEVPEECRNIKFSGKPIFGTQRRDVLNGTNGNDLIFAFEGNDVVNGSNGNDCVVGGSGDDLIHNSNGNDFLFGNEGNDRLNGSNGHDFISGGEGNDRISGSNGNDRILGGEGDDDIDSSNGDDYVEAGGGNDKVDAGNGDDQVFGDAGNDTLRGSNGNDVLRGGLDKDSARGDLGRDSCEAETKNSCENSI